MHNFARINNHYNNIQAREDWTRIAKQYPLSKQFDPGPNATWRKIDKAIKAVRSTVLHIERCQSCDAPPYTVKASEIVNCGNVSACDFCGHIQIPVEYQESVPAHIAALWENDKEDGSV